MSNPVTVGYWQQQQKVSDRNFHGEVSNSILISNLKRFRLDRGSRIFMPFCSKTLDIHWLLAQGYEVCGIESTLLPVEDLFHDLGLSPTKVMIDELIELSAPHLNIWVGDYFKLTKEILGEVHAVYDHVSLVALPHAARVKYTQQMLALLGTNPAPQLLITHDIDRLHDGGPIHHVSQKDISAHYPSIYRSIQFVEKTRTGAIGWVLES